MQATVPHGASKDGSDHAPMFNRFGSSRMCFCTFRSNLMLSLGLVVFIWFLLPYRRQSPRVLRSRGIEGCRRRRVSFSLSQSRNQPVARPVVFGLDLLVLVHSRLIFFLFMLPLGAVTRRGQAILRACRKSPFRLRKVRRRVLNLNVGTPNNHRNRNEDRICSVCRRANKCSLGRHCRHRGQLS